MFSKYRFNRKKKYYNTLNETDHSSLNFPQKPKPKMKFTESAFYDIINTIGSRKAESGGLLFGNESDYIVRKFVFDKNAKTTSTSYTFNTEFLNPEIKRLWNEEGLSCLGFIHSHPYGYSGLSTPDMEYFTKMFNYMPREKYLVPIIFTVPDGGFKINAHILPKEASKTITSDIEIIPDDVQKVVLTCNHQKDDENIINFFDAALIAVAGSFIGISLITLIKVVTK